jgi:predicted AAA+ superfamily ATPase
MQYFQDYLHHGFYPFFLEKRNFAENLLKTMNMMMEVDILLIQQIELGYLSKLKKLLYLLASDSHRSPNVSALADEIGLSRATVMNYIKYLADARLINLVYKPGDDFPKKPARVLLHNPNLAYSIYPVKADEDDVAEMFFVNSLWKDHVVNKGEIPGTLFIDNRHTFHVTAAVLPPRVSPGMYYAVGKKEKGRDNLVPLWMFGLLY